MPAMYLVKAPVSQLAEESDLKSLCCGFESHRGHTPPLGLVHADGVQNLDGSRVEGT